MFVGAINAKVSDLIYAEREIFQRGEGFLQYLAKCGESNLEEVVKTWIKKHR